MLLGLLERTLRETWRTIAWTCLGLALVIALFVRILPSVQELMTKSGRTEPPAELLGCGDRARADENGPPRPVYLGHSPHHG